MVRRLILKKHYGTAGFWVSRRGIHIFQSNGFFILTTSGQLSSNQHVFLSPGLSSWGCQGCKILADVKPISKLWNHVNLLGPLCDLKICGSSLLKISQPIFFSRLRIFLSRKASRGNLISYALPYLNQGADYAHQRILAPLDCQTFL